MQYETVSISSIIVASEEQISSDLGGEAVIPDLKPGTYYGLDTAGARIWNLIREPRSVEDIGNVLIDEYEVTSDRCEHDGIAGAACCQRSYKDQGWDQFVNFFC